MSRTGFLDNLTTEQTETLKELWKRLFDTFDQESEESTKRSSGSGTSTPAASPLTAKPKIKLGGLFRKKKTYSVDDNDGASINSALSMSDRSPSRSELVLNLPVQLPRGLREAFWAFVYTDNPDALLLRFLRARKWDVGKAYDMTMATLRWRLDEYVDEVILLGEEGIMEMLDQNQAGQGEGFMLQLTSGKSYLGRPDNGGRPIMYINVRYHHKEDQTLASLQQFILYMLETLRLLTAQPVETACVIFDMEDFTMGNMVNAANLFYVPKDLELTDQEFIRFLISCLQEHYPESLGICLVHKAPWIFSGKSGNYPRHCSLLTFYTAVWKLISPLLDPIVAAKIQMTENNEDLLRYVPKESLPSSLGGTNETLYRFIPASEDTRTSPTVYPEEIERLEKDIHDLETEYERQTQAWVDGQGEGEGRRSIAMRHRVARLRLDHRI